MKYIAVFLLMLMLATQAYAAGYKFMTKSFSTYGWAMDDTDRLDAEKRKVFDEFSKAGEVVDIQETVHTVSGTATMYTYTAKIKAE